MMQLRSVRVEDLDALYLLDQRCFSEGIAYSKEELSYFLFETPSLALIAEEHSAEECVAEGEKKLAGFVIAELASASSTHLITIDVTPEKRRHGVGRLLMEAILEGAECAGVEAMDLEVAVDNLEAQAFYRKAGFVETGRVTGYYLGTLDAFTMRKFLRA